MTDKGPNPYAVDIEKETLDNENFRTTLWTGENMQLTVMAIPVGEDIGLEVHDDHDQFLRIEEGEGLAQMGPSKDNLNFEQKVEDDWIVMVPAGSWHNVTNTGDKPLKLYSLYAPPEHVPGTIHKTKADEAADPNEH